MFSCFPSRALRRAPPSREQRTDGGTSGERSEHTKGLRANSASRPVDKTTRKYPLPPDKTLPRNPHGSSAFSRKAQTRNQRQLTNSSFEASESTPSASSPSSSGPPPPSRATTLRAPPPASDALGETPDRREPATAAAAEDTREPERRWRCPGVTDALPPPPPPAADGKWPEEEKDSAGLRGPRAPLKPPLRLRSPRPNREDGAGELSRELLPQRWARCRDERREKLALRFVRNREREGTVTRGRDRSSERMGNKSPGRVVLRSTHREH